MDEWKEYKLGEVCDVRDGTHDSPKECSYGKPLVTSKNIKNGRIDLVNTYLISDKDYDSVNRRSKVDVWDVLFSMIGTVGECAIVKDTVSFAIKNVGLFKTGGNELLAKWIYYYFQSNSAKAEIDAKIKGSTQQYIALGDLRSFPILFPPIEIQRYIIGILECIDDKIDLLHQENKTLEAMAETLFRKWFIEEAKEEWEEKTLYDCISLVGGGTPKTNNETYWNGNISWISGGDISNNHKGYIIDTDKNITLEGLNNSSTKLLPENAFVISARGTVGKYCLLSKPMTFSQSNYGVLPKEHGCYFFTYLLVSYCVDELQSAAYGSVFDTITINTFKGINIFIPSEKEIIIFENRIKDFFGKIKLNTEQIRELTTIKELLLLRLMSNTND